MNRRQTMLGLSLMSVALLEGCDSVMDKADKPVVQLRLDAPVSEVQAHSTYKFASEFLQGIPGKEFITAPHVLVYQDETLTLRVEDAGGVRTMPTNLGYAVRLDPAEPESTINYLSVHALADYSPLPVALEHARELRDALLMQGFIVQERHWKKRFDGVWEAAPQHLDAFDDLEPAFLNSTFYLKDATVFTLLKNHLRVELAMINGRRKWGSRTDPTDISSNPAEERATKEASSMTQKDLRAEPVYSLVLSIGPTDEWAKQRGDLREVERKKRQGVKRF